MTRWWTFARQLAVVIMTALHFASSCSSSRLAQGDDRWGAPLRWPLTGRRPSPHPRSPVPQAAQVCLRLSTGTDEGRGGQDPSGRVLPLILSPEDGSSSSPVESDAGCWQQSGQVPGGPDTDPRLVPGAKRVCPSAWLGLAVAGRWARSLLLDLGGLGLGADPGNRTPCLCWVWRGSQGDTPMRSARRSVCLGVRTDGCLATLPQDVGPYV